MRRVHIIGVALFAATLSACSDVLSPEIESAEAIDTELSWQTDPCPNGGCLDPIEVEGHCEAGYTRNDANQCVCTYGWCGDYNTDPGGNDGGSGGGDNGGSGGSGGSGGGGCLYCGDDVNIAEPPPGIVEEYYNELTRAEKILCVTTYASDIQVGMQPLATRCGRHASISYQASQWAPQQVDQNGDPLTGCGNGPCDAVRHAFWSAALTREFGEVEAQRWTDAHEMGSGYDPEETPMDLHNNYIGRGIASMTGDIGTLVMQVYNGQLPPLSLHVLLRSEWSD